jgi:hypothetical protein
METQSESSHNKSSQPTQQGLGLCRVHEFNCNNQVACSSAHRSDMQTLVSLQHST